MLIRFFTVLLSSPLRLISSPLTLIKCALRLPPTDKLHLWLEMLILHWFLQYLRDLCNSSCGKVFFTLIKFFTFIIINNK